jgi:hypothetical protein
MHGSAWSASATSRRACCASRSPHCEHRRVRSSARSACCESRRGPSSRSKTSRSPGSAHLSPGSASAASRRVHSSARRTQGMPCSGRSDALSPRALFARARGDSSFVQIKTGRYDRAQNKLFLAGWTPEVVEDPAPHPRSSALLRHGLREHLLDQLVPITFERAHGVLRPPQGSRHGRDRQLPEHPRERQGREAAVLRGCVG